MNFWDQIHSLVIERNFDTALRKLGESNADSEDSRRRALYILCVQLLTQNNVNEIQQELDELVEDQISNPEKSLLLTLQGYISLFDENEDQGEKFLKMAVQEDPTNALARFSLGRQLINSEQDKENAEQHLLQIVRDYPKLIPARMSLVALYAEWGKFRNAINEAQDVIMREPAHIPGWLALITSALAATPLSGRFALLVCMTIAFFPYIGPAIVAAWTTLTLVSLIGLRRYSFRLIAYMLIGNIPIIAIYTFRGIVSGRYFP